MSALHELGPDDGSETNPIPKRPTLAAVPDSLPDVSSLKPASGVSEVTKYEKLGGMIAEAAESIAVAEQTHRRSAGYKGRKRYYKNGPGPYAKERDLQAFLKREARGLEMGHVALQFS